MTTSLLSLCYIKKIVNAVITIRAWNQDFDTAKTPYNEVHHLMIQQCLFISIFWGCAKRNYPFSNYRIISCFFIFVNIFLYKYDIMPCAYFVNFPQKTNDIYMSQHQHILNNNGVAPPSCYRKRKLNEINCQKQHQKTSTVRLCRN